MNFYFNAASFWGIVSPAFDAMRRISTSRRNETLAHSLNVFLGKSYPWLTALHRVRSALREAGIVAYLFGGLVRDLAMRRLPVVRDIDIVTDQTIDVAAFLPDCYGRRRTRFGGFSFRLAGVRFDVWSLPTTWAFREGLIAPAEFSELPATTFFNIEAIAMEFTASGFPTVYEKGFWNCLRERTLEVNLATNPFPALCIVRTATLSLRFGFRIGASLADVLSRFELLCSDADLVDAQSAHYGIAKFKAHEIRKWLDTLKVSSQFDLHCGFLPKRSSAIQTEFSWDEAFSSGRACEPSDMI